METRKPEINIERGEENNTVRVSGELTYYHMSELRDFLRIGLERDPSKNFVFDLAECTFVDSGCMGLMVEFKMELEKRGSDMSIINVSILVEEAMKRIGMDSIVSIKRKK